MKTTVSIPDEIFEQAEDLARRLKKSRSELYREALAEYVARHDADAITEELDRAVGEVADEDRDFVRKAGRRLLERSR